MKEWHLILEKVLVSGHMRQDRTGTGTLSLFGEQLRFDNRAKFGTEGVFPAVTTKKLAFRQMAAELSCFLKGYRSLDEFHAEGCHIWDGNGSAAYWTGSRHRLDDRDLGRIYGTQWREWRGVDPHGIASIGCPGDVTPVIVDQLAAVIGSLRNDPFSRRHLVTSWNPAELDQVCLPPCHVLWQCYVRPSEDGTGSTLDIRVDMRSVDLFLGLPFDVASYGLLQRLLAETLGMDSGWLTFQLGDAHLYLNHQDAARIVLMREPFDPPGLALAPGTGPLSFGSDRAVLTNYRHHPAVPAPLNI